MTRTLPIPAGQPPDATWTAAGQVVTLAGAEVVAVQAAASITLAALLWPLIPAARAIAGLASTLGQRPPLCPLPEQEASAPAKVVVVMPGSGGAGRAATVPGGPPGTVRAAGVITLGVEEEFLLLDPSTGATVLAAPDLVRMLGEPGVRPELMRFQVETATAVCTSLDEAGRELIRLRRLAADAAAHLGCRLVASGVAPYGTPGLDALTPQPRYQELARRYAPVVAQAGTCACHVHVGVPSRDLGVQVLARLRPWLAPLLAITANSPIADGHDTEFIGAGDRDQARAAFTRAGDAYGTLGAAADVARLHAAFQARVYRFRTHRRCCDLRFGRMSQLRKDRGLCPFACST